MAVGRRTKLHASHLARMDRIRREFWTSYRPRQEIEAYREQIVANQRRAEKVNELRRLEGALANTTRHHRLGYIRGERERLTGVRDQLLASLGVTNSEGLL